MANGSYNIGEIVIITLQLVNPDYSPIVGMSPVVDEIILPDGNNGILSPLPMVEVSTSPGTYTVSYLPAAPGNYTVLMSVVVNGSTMISMDTFLVNTTSQITVLPRGVVA